MLTDGSIIISGQGELFKQFYVRDGLGIKFLQDCGIQVAICTGRQSDIVIERAKELGITLLMQGQKDKREGLAEICRQAGVSRKKPLIWATTFPTCASSHWWRSPVLPRTLLSWLWKACWVSRFPGGHGAVRELAEFILKSQGRFEEAVMKRFNTEL